MDREKIIKALECCTSESDSCTGCPFRELGACKQSSLLKLALSLIKELAEDNEYLKTALTACEARYDSRKESDLEEVLELRLKVDELTEENEKLVKLLDSKCDDCIVRERTDAVTKMLVSLAVHFGTYTENDTVKIKDVFRLLDQIEKEMLDER